MKISELKKGQFVVVTGNHQRGLVEILEDAHPTTTMAWVAKAREPDTDRVFELTTNAPDGSVAAYVGEMIEPASPEEIAAVKNGSPRMVTDAMAFVRGALAGKKRKGSGAPYECHLLGVLGIVAGYGGGPNIQAAAVLHDVVEDCGVSLAEIEARFSPVVAKLVSHVTEDKSLPWLQRKLKIADLAGVRCQAVGLLLMADKIDNLRAFARESGGSDDYWRRFQMGFEQQKEWHFRLLTSLAANPRITGETEYPELRTRAALLELCEAYDTFCWMCQAGESNHDSPTALRLGL